MYSSTIFKTFFFCCLLLASGALFNETNAQYSDTELGVILGEPTGISVQLWQSRSRSFDGAVAWSLGRHENLHIHADYLIHNPIIVDEGSLSFYYGIGARALLADDPRFGARGPVGLYYRIQSSRVSLFVEVAPIFDLIPATEFNMNGGLGVRFAL